MDFTKFKIALCILGLLSLQVCVAQYDIPIYVTAGINVDSLAAPRLRTYAEVDFTYRKVDTAYVSGYGGYNILIANQSFVPVHLEDYDDFNISVFAQDSTINIIYSGAQGAIKNDFLYNRNKAFIQFAKKVDIKNYNQQIFENSVDSLINVWSDQLKSYPFSKLFVEDETMYYKSYANYSKLYLKQLSLGKDLSDLELKDFPALDYTSGRYFTTIPQYKELAKAYHFKKLLLLESKRDGRRYMNRMDSDFIVENLKERAISEALEHHPRAQFLYDVSKPLYDPHLSENRRYYRFSKKNAAGDSFNFPVTSSIDGKRMEWNSIKANKIYFFFYYLSDPSLRKNIVLWNQWYANNKKDGTYFIAVAMDGKSKNGLWKNLQFNSSIAGLSVTMEPKDAKKYRIKTGMKLTPRVVEVNANKLIADPNVDIEFEKVNFIIQ